MHLVIIRTALSYIDSQTYNIQEIGLAKELVKQGMTVSLIFPGKLQKEDHENEYSIYYLTCKMLQQSIGYYNNLWKTLDKIRPDVIQIHDFGMFMSLYALLWSKKENIPCVLVQGTYEPTRKPLQRVLECLYNLTFAKYLLKRVDGIGCKTPKAAEYIRKYNKTQNIEITAIGLDISKFEQQRTAENIWIKNLQISPSSKVLLYIGVIESRRHVDLLLDVLERLPDEYTLIIVGEGSQKEILKNRATLGVYSKRVKWLDKMKQEELSNIYRIADLFLLASDYEIYGMVILESMYLKVPVLSTSTGGALAIIQDDVNGYLIESFNVQDWVEKIKEIFGDKLRYNKVKTSGYQFITDNLMWKQASLKFIELYHNAIDKCEYK